MKESDIRTLLPQTRCVIWYLHPLRKQLLWRLPSALGIDL
jgi:hypothetical protein